MTTTQKQREANRRNARLSTGPRTPEGKARASQNAVTHGFFAREVLLPQEDAEQFDAFSQAMHDDLHPQGALEEVLAAQVVVCAWRLQRLTRIETGVFADFLSDATRHYCLVQQRDVQYRQQHTVTYPDIPEEAIWGHAFNHYNAKDEPLEKITRYINLVTREFYRALRELHRLQAKPARRSSQSEGGSSENNPKAAFEQNEPISAEPSVLSATQNEPISTEEAPCPSGGQGLGRGDRGAHAIEQNEPISPSNTSPITNQTESPNGATDGHQVPADLSPCWGSETPVMSFPRAGARGKRPTPLRG